jgi:hypothetical protein
MSFGAPQQRRQYGLSLFLCAPVRPFTGRWLVPDGTELPSPQWWDREVLATAGGVNVTTRSLRAVSVSVQRD